MPEKELSFRVGSSKDLAAAFELAFEAMREQAVRLGVATGAPTVDAAALSAAWEANRPLVELIDAQPDGAFEICEAGDGEIVGYARVVRFGEMEELAELMVRPGHQRRGIGHSLLERCWPNGPSRDVGRIAVAVGTPHNLSLYSDFGVMPIAGHWHLVQPAKAYLERRSRELDSTEPGVSLLKPDGALAEWRRLEPLAIGHDRSALHEFFSRDRQCLATVDHGSGHARGLCWISHTGEIGPAVGETPEDLVPVVLAALDRVAKIHEPENLRVFCTTLSWWLLRRLRALGFQVFWPSWIMCSVPLPGLDRYVPTMPPQLL